MIWMISFTLMASVASPAYSARSKPAAAVNANLDGMILIPSGEFAMGCGKECPMEDAKPLHKVRLKKFWIDETPVTNAQFSQFVGRTHYKTVAEQTPNAADYPGVPKENLRAGSAGFTPANVSLLNPYAWWKHVPGAYWRRINGPNSKDAVKSFGNFPVVHVAYDDALAYCHWAGKDLPTEAQFEYAARGGMSRKKYAWGNELKPKGKWVANIWQGKFPSKDLAEDGHAGLAPVDTFPKNKFGLYDMAGNVWHWTKDWYRSDTYKKRAKLDEIIVDPTGPADSFDSSEPGIKKRVQRGGSFLCSDQYCIRYLVGSRGRGSPDSSSSNLGFRCVRQ